MRMALVWWMPSFLFCQSSSTLVFLPLRVSLRPRLPSPLELFQVHAKVPELGARAWTVPIPVMPTYHPAYLLRSPGEKAKTWEDLKMVMAHLELPLPKK